MRLRVPTQILRATIRRGSASPLKRKKVDRKEYMMVGCCLASEEAWLDYLHVVREDLCVKSCESVTVCMKYMYVHLLSTGVV